MKEIAFVKPNYPNEKRVCLLPEDIISLKNDVVFSTIYIEEGFGENLRISDEKYVEAGCIIATRKECFSKENIFSLKLIQEIDYNLLREDGNIIGWMHPTGSGEYFCNTIAKEKNINIFDIDSVYPTIYPSEGRPHKINSLPPQFFWENSYLAGIASCKAALEFKKHHDITTKNICILGCGSVSQGAFQYFSSLGAKPRMFYRKTMPIFYQNISQFDLIINGIEISEGDDHILSAENLSQTKSDVYIIDAAADAGRAIEGTKYLSWESPTDYVNNRLYFLVNNAPSYLFEEASEKISKVVSTLFLTKDYFSKK